MKSCGKSLSGRQLHIAYHGGDHYDSVRRIGDNSHSPANIFMEVESGLKNVASNNKTCAYQESDLNSYDIYESNIENLVT